MCKMLRDLIIYNAPCLEKAFKENINIYHIIKILWESRLKGTSSDLFKAFNLILEDLSEDSDIRKSILILIKAFNLEWPAGALQDEKGLFEPVVYNIYSLLVKALNIKNVRDDEPGYYLLSRLEKRSWG